MFPPPRVLTTTFLYGDLPKDGPVPCLDLPSSSFTMPPRSSEKPSAEPLTQQPSEKLPTYEEIRAERTLKDAFSKLVKDHDEIQKLFVSVAAELEATPKIGKDHHLCSEWNTLRKVSIANCAELGRSADTVRACSNTGNCTETPNSTQANVLASSTVRRGQLYCKTLRPIKAVDFSTILIPLSRSRMTLPEKHLMIDKFLEAIPAHQEAARLVAVKFQELSKDVEIFPVKVSSYLRNEAEGTGLLAGIWSGVEELCMSIWNVRLNSVRY